MDGWAGKASGFFTISATVESTAEGRGLAKLWMDFFKRKYLSI